MSETKAKPKFAARIVRATAAGTVIGVVLAGLSASLGTLAFLTPAQAFVVGQAAAQAIELSKDLET